LRGDFGTMTAAVNVQVGLVPLVKSHYKEFLKEQVRLKQQLLNQFQQKKKSKSKSRSKGHHQHQQRVSTQAIERIRSHEETATSLSSRTNSFSAEEDRALLYGAKYDPVNAVRRSWLRATGALSGGMDLPFGDAAYRPREGRSVAYRSPYAGVDYETMTQVDSSLLRHLLLKGVARFCQFWAANLMSSCTVEGREIMHEAILGRVPGQALITVSNHVSSLDDPFVTSMIVPDEALEPGMSIADVAGEGTSSDGESVETGDGGGGDAAYSNRVRWVMCATDRCFKTKMAADFFKAVQVLPVERGSGLRQPSMAVASSLLSKGGWVHVFPEGTRSTTGELLRMKPGVGKLVVDTLSEIKEKGSARTAPLIVPYYHEGMGDLLEKGRKLPKVGTSLRVKVGRPIDIQDLAAKFATGKMTEKEVIAHVMTRVDVAIRDLKATM